MESKLVSLAGVRGGVIRRTMVRYLVVFGRDSSSMLETRQFDDVKSALRARLKAEAHYVDRPRNRPAPAAGESRLGPS